MSVKPTGPKPAPKSKRHAARLLAAQALYQWSYTGATVEQLVADALSHESAIVDEAYFRAIMLGVLEQVTSVDEALAPCLDRALTEVSPVELAILRLGAFELLYRLDVPYRVAIHEAMEAAKQFGADDSHKYMNAVLDRLAKRVRAAEVQARAQA